MNVTIHPSQVKGSVNAPPSKSYTHRAVAIASLAKGVSVIKHPLISDDNNYTIEACRKLGAFIEEKKDSLIIQGVDGHFPKKPGKIDIFCGNSGTTMRLITALSSLTESDVSIDGEKRLRERPIADLLEALKMSGTKVNVPNKISLPIYIKGGKIKGGKIKISGEQSSQFISVLLLISPYAESDTTIVVNKLRSKFYVNITIDLMKTFGVKVEANDNRYFVKSGQYYQAKKYTVEGDYSSASYFFAAAAITDSTITMQGLNPNSAQGDKNFLFLLEKMGCIIHTDKISITFKGSTLQGITANLGNYPDIVPSLAVVAATIPGKSTIINIKQLRYKESDRITALEDGLQKMGIKTDSTIDTLTIEGGNLYGAEIDTRNDHRIAMAFAVAGLVAKGETKIKNAGVVSKSYPQFWNDFKKIGAKIKQH